MAHTKHTLGQWETLRAVKQSNFGQFKTSVTVDAPCPNSADGRMYKTTVATITGRNREEVEANAYIIAAAPDMEHALRTLMVALNEKEPEAFPGHHAAYLRTVAIPRALAAIAKARGEKEMVA